MKTLKTLIYRLFRYLHPNHSRTVRYAFPLMLTFSLLGAAVILPEDQSYVRLEFSDAQIIKGEPFAVNVFVNANIPVNAVNIELAFPKDKIDVTGIETGESVITIWTKEPYWDSSKIYLSGGTFRRGFLGEHKIAVVSAVAKETGEAKFISKQIELLAGDGSGTKVKVDNVGSESLIIIAKNTDGTVHAAAEIRIYTDINGDGLVTMADILSFMSAWALQNTVYDFNHDNRMNFTDFSIILADSWRY